MAERAARGRRVVLVFARAPVPGRVKTRLVPALGAAGAARVHRALVRRTLAVAARIPGARLELWCDGGPPHPFLRREAARVGARVRVQRGPDLGARMDHALRQALRRRPRPAAVLVGTDCPMLDASHLEAAFRALERGGDGVLGPAADGGYVLIGLRRPCGALFRGIPWGTGEVLATTRRAAAAVGVRLRELPPRADLDRPEDWAALSPDLRRRLLGGILSA